MDTKILIIGLLAFSLVLFGCAKGGTASTPGGATSGIQGAGEQAGAPSTSGEVGAEGNGGAAEPVAGGEEPQAGAGAETQTGAGNGSEQDIGGLFNIDTVQPESGSGYEVPAAGE
ncbi:MAG: hypothetical protein WC350_05820 [Candidatus Micrarchaeia archaeon]|jgi:hypothetical protein